MKRLHDQLIPNITSFESGFDPVCILIWLLCSCYIVGIQMWTHKFLIDMKIWHQKISFLVFICKLYICIATVYPPDSQSNENYIWHRFENEKFLWLSHWVVLCFIKKSEKRIVTKFLFKVHVNKGLKTILFLYCASAWNRAMTFVCKISYLNHIFLAKPP